MIDNSQNPCEYDAVLGGNSAPPVNAVVLGGIEGLNRRLETGNTQQKIDSLSDALKYGEAGIDLLIRALNDGEIKVRAKAFEILETINLKRIKKIINKGIPLINGDKLYSVYASDIDYDDSYHHMIDSLEKFENSCYETNPQLVGCYIYRKKALVVAEDLHQTILRGSKLSEFIRRNHLNIENQIMNNLKQIFDYAGNHLCEFDVPELNIMNINDFCIENELLLELNPNEEV